MRYSFAIALALLSLLSYAQQQHDKGTIIDQLRSSSSPGSVILGISPSEIEKPTDPSEFMVSLQSATNSFTRLPSNYAVDISPFWLLSKGSVDFTTNGLRSSSGRQVFKQTLVLSFAMRNPDSLEKNFSPTNSYLGAGFKFSIFRGSYDSKTNEILGKIKEIQRKRLPMLYETLSYLKESSEYQALEKKRDALIGRGTNAAERAAIMESEEFIEVNKEINRLTAEFQKRMTENKRARDNTSFSELADDIQALEEELRPIATQFMASRCGFTWDVSGAISTEFRDRRFNNSKVHKAGLWTTMGYTGEKWGSALGIVRYLYNPDQIIGEENLPAFTSSFSTFDAGIRLVYGPAQTKFNASMEIIYRSVIGESALDPGWRLVFNAEYTLFRNQKLSFSFGRDFNGTITKDGNLVAALNFLTGFGNRR